MLNGVGEYTNNYLKYSSLSNTVLLRALNWHIKI